MTLLIIVVLITLFISTLCSLLEGFILSVTTAEIEAVKGRRPRTGARLEKHKAEIEITISAILTLNTVVNVGGSTTIGYLIGEFYDSAGVALFTAILTLVILFFCEILPKNVGVLFRRPLINFLMAALDWVLFFMRPVATLCKVLLRVFLPQRRHMSDEEREEEVLLLVNKGLRDGVFSVTESEIISNSFLLSDHPATVIMTPLDRIFALHADERILNAIRHIGGTSYSRLPIYEGAQIIGVVNRNELLHAGAIDNHESTVRSIMKPVMRLNAELTLADLLQCFLKNRQKLCIIEGAANQTLGLVTLKDVIDYLLGHKPTHKQP